MNEKQKDYKVLQPYEWVENLTEIQLKNALVLTGAEYEMEIIKEYNCYFFNFESLETIKNGVSYFGYSVLVFKNGKQIKFVADHQLHHNYYSETPTEKFLKDFYIKQLNGRIKGQFNKAIYTEAEILNDPVKNYSDYKLKENFIRNYYVLQFDSVSPWFIDEPDAEQENAKNNYKFSGILFRYFKNDIDLRKCETLLKVLNKKYNETILNDNKQFKKAIRYELQNHEACYTGDYTDALNALGLRFEDLSKDKQKIVLECLNHEMYRDDI